MSIALRHGVAILLGRIIACYKPFGQTFADEEFILIGMFSFRRARGHGCITLTDFATEWA